MALRPELVRTDLIADDRFRPRGPFYELIPTPPEPRPPRGGVLAEASKASGGEGRPGLGPT